MGIWLVLPLITALVIIPFLHILIQFASILRSNPGLCPKCCGRMRIISIIEDQAVIKKILVHLNLWVTKNHDPPPISSPDIEFACRQVQRVQESGYTG